MPDIIDCDVVIQAGHEDTPDDMTGGSGPLGREIDWTPVVANEAVRLLKNAGVDAVKETAHIKVTKQHYRCKLAIFIHFDDPEHGESGPSLGYDHSSDADAADEWKALYQEYFPYNETWLRDNATPREQYYYAFKYTVTTDAEFVVELGDLHSLRQAKWLKPRLKWLGQLVAYFVSHRIGKGGLAKPAPFNPPQAALMMAPKSPPAGSSQPYHTPASISSNANGHSKTKGLQGTQQKLADGTLVIEATEALSAARKDGLDATRTALWREVWNGDVATIHQENYSYKDRVLPDSTIFRDVAAMPKDVPDGFRANAVRSVRASQFGKNDTEDEGTGSPLMGLIQTNSEVFGASVKMAVMTKVFGKSWKKNDKRLTALIDVYFSSAKRMVRVPLVDVGPGAGIKAEVDLTWACDQFLGTHGQADVQYRILVPT